MKKWVKEIIGIAAGVALVAFVTFKVADRIYERDLDSIYESYGARLSELRIEKDSIQRRADSIDFVLDKRDAEFQALVRVEQEHRQEIDRLNAELLGAYNDLFDVWTEDEHYKSLQVMFPTEDSLKYPFAGHQVKDMHVRIVDGIYKDSLLVEYASLNNILKGQLNNVQGSLGIVEVERDDCLTRNMLLYAQMNGTVKENLDLKKENKKLKKERRITRGIGGGILAGLAVALIAL
jgi:hypothetical protein